MTGPGQHDVEGKVVTHFEGRSFTESILSRAEGFKTTIYAGVNLSTVVQIDHTPISFFPRVAGEDEEGGARLNVCRHASEDKHGFQSA
jgi:hypothetical protein